MSLLLAPAPGGPGCSSQQGAVLAEQPNVGVEAGKSMGMVFFHPQQQHPGPGLCASFTAGLCKEPLAHPAAAMAFPVLPCACPLQTLRVDKG